jgi:integrase
LLAFHASAQTGPLFPELKRDAHGQFGAVSRFFNNYFKRVGVKVDKSVNFHSLRHTISDAFRRAQLRNDDFAPLLGHVKGTTTSRYGILPEGNLANFKKMIDAVEYPGISLR